MLKLYIFNLLKNSILLFLLLFLCTANGNAETVDINGTSYDINTLIDRDLGPGINYKRIRLADFPLNVNILQMDMNNPYNRIETTIGQDQMFKTESLVAAANRQSYAGHEVVAGANANFWCVSSQYPWADYLIGACYNANLKNGKIATETNMANDQWVGGYTESGIIAVDTDKNLYINSWPFYAFVRSDKTGNQMIYQFNKVCRDNEVALYNSWYPNDKTFLPVDTYQSENGTTHFIEVDGVSTELYLTLDEGQDWMAGRELTFTIGEIRKNQAAGTRNGYDAVLLVRGATRNYFDSLELGDKLTIMYGWSSQLSGEGTRPEIEQAVGGNTLVMTGGKITETNYHQGYNTQTYSRCAYGSDATGRKLYVIVIDMSTDPTYGTSKGCTTEVMAQIISHYGCTELVNCDAGGSAQMLVEGKIINKTTEGSPRAVANGMFLYNIAPEDNTITRLEFEDYELIAPIYAKVTPILLGYNKYGALISKNVQDVTLSCDESLGTCSGNSFTATGSATTGMLTATLGDVTVTKEIKVLGADMSIRIKNLLIDSFRKYPIEVTSTIGSTVYTYDPALIDWTVADPEIVNIDENGVLTGLKEGQTTISCTIGDFSDTANVTVEIPDSHSVSYGDPAEWTVTGSSGLTNVTFSADGIVTYTYGSPRGPVIKLAKSQIFYSLPDRILLSFKSDIDVNSILLDFRRGIDTKTHNVTLKPNGEETVFTAGTTHTVEIPIENPEDLINYPLSLHSIAFYLNTSGVTKGEHSLELCDIRAEYDNVAGIESITADADNFTAIYPNPVNSGETLNISSAKTLRSIEIYSTSGAKVFAEKICGNTASITAPSVIPGVYIAKITSETEVAMKKIIIKN